MQRFSKFKRAIEFRWSPNPVTGSAALFLWGARQTGKTTLLHEQFSGARHYDLLDTTLSAELSLQPRRLREDVLAHRPDVVVIDEVQKIPDLLEEVHWLLENSSTRFVLCGSSARKLRRRSHNLLGGRAVDVHLRPLTSHEIGDVDLDRALRHGTLPAHYLADDPTDLLRSYVNNYVKAEIIDESATRNVPAFARFLQVMGLSHGEQVNYSAVARDCGVSASTVRSYFQILEETLIGDTLEPWRRRVRRRLADTAKFYVFDVGVANRLHPESAAVAPGSDRFGRSFEHFLINEVRAFLSYGRRDDPLSFWRTSSGFEVDLIVGDMALAVEFKATRDVRSGDLKGLRALVDEFTVGRRLLVCREAARRRTEDGIDILPWRDFCLELWAGQLV